MSADDADHPPMPRPGEAYWTRVSLFGRLNAERTTDRETAWVEFRARYAPMIAGFAKRCGANRQDIDDIIQDVMTGFVTAAEAFVYDPAKGRFRGWLKTCTVRAALRRAGKNLRFQGVPLDSVQQPELAVEPLWNDVWEKELMARALADLRQRYGGESTYRAFEQYVLFDRSAADVATELKISIDRVYQAKTRLTKELRDAVARATELAG